MTPAHATPTTPSPPPARRLSSNCPRDLPARPSRTLLPARPVRAPRPVLCTRAMANSQVNLSSSDSSSDAPQPCLSQPHGAALPMWRRPAVQAAPSSASSDAWGSQWRSSPPPARQAAEPHPEPSPCATSADASAAMDTSGSRVSTRNQQVPAPSQPRQPPKQQCLPPNWGTEASRVSTRTHPKPKPSASAPGTQPKAVPRPPRDESVAPRPARMVEPSRPPGGGVDWNSS